MCNLSYPACKACALYYIVICGLSGSTIFCHIISNGTNFGKKILIKKMCFDFLLNLVWNFSHSKKNLARYDHKCILVLMQSSCYTCVFLIQLGFFKKFSKNNSISNFIKIRPMGAELFYVDGRRDRQTDMAEITVNFRDFAKELKNLDIFHFRNIDRKT